MLEHAAQIMLLRVGERWENPRGEATAALPMMGPGIRLRTSLSQRPKCDPSFCGVRDLTRNNAPRIERAYSLI